MKKSDLEYGNVVETRKGIKYLLYHCNNSDKFVNLDFDSFLWISNFDENLKEIDFDDFDIMKVYKDYTCKELLWERKEEPQLTEDEKVILRNLPKRNKWIARDIDGCLYVYASKPHKSKTIWDSYGVLFPFHHLFKFIKYEDEEPYSIEDLLRE